MQLLHSNMFLDQKQTGIMKTFVNTFHHNMLYGDLKIMWTTFSRARLNSKPKQPQKLSECRSNETKLTERVSVV